MKLAGFLLVLTFSIASFADNFYVRKTVAGTDVKDVDANRVRNLIANELSAQSGGKLVKNSAQANSVYRAFLDKTDSGFSLRLERSVGGKIVSTAEASAQDAAHFSEATKSLTQQAAADTASIVPTSLPPKTAAPTEVYRSAAQAPVAEAQTQSVDSKKTASAAPKNWYVSLGPIFSPNLLGTNTGTKYVLAFGYNQALSEKTNLLYFYEGNFNTSSIGSTPVSIIGAGLQFLLNDRLSTNSAFLQVDLGYGGANRNEDAAATGGLGIGWDFFRTTDFTFEVMVRHLVLGTSATTGIGAFPAIDQLRFGVYF